MFSLSGMSHSTAIAMAPAAATSPPHTTTNDTAAIAIRNPRLRQVMC
jgi:hypothetical protein